MAIADTKINTKVDARVLVHLLQADLVWEARASAKSRDLCLALASGCFTCDSALYVARLETA